MILWPPPPPLPRPTDHQPARALGDFPFKQASKLPPAAQAISGEPETRIVPRTRGLPVPAAAAAAATAGGKSKALQQWPTEWLLIASDGVWDVMSNTDLAAHLMLRCVLPPALPPPPPPSGRVALARCPLRFDGTG